MQTQEEAIKRCPGKQTLKHICAPIPPVLHLYFIGSKKYFVLLFLHESRIKLISNQFDYKLTLHQVQSCFLKLFEINIIPSHSNQPSSLPFELIDRFLYEDKIDFKLIKIQLCKAKMSVMRVGYWTPATS